MQNILRLQSRNIATEKNLIIQLQERWQEGLKILLCPILSYKHKEYCQQNSKVSSFVLLCRVNGGDAAFLFSLYHKIAGSARKC